MATAESPKAAGLSLRRFELLVTAFQFVYQYNHPGVSSYFSQSDSMMAPRFSIKNDELKSLLNKKPEPIDVHTLLEILHEEIPSFKVPAGYHDAPTVGNIKKLLKYFEDERQLNFLAAKINKERSLIHQLNPSQ